MKWNDDDLGLALRGLREEQPADAAITALHARVMADVRKPRSRWWVWAIVPVAAAVVVAVLVWPRTEPLQPPVEVARSPIPAATPSPDETKPIAPARTVPDRTNPIPPNREELAVRRETKPIYPARTVPDKTNPILRVGVPRIEATETPGMVRIASSDPNIVILWSLDDAPKPSATPETNQIEPNEGEFER